MKAVAFDGSEAILPRSQIFQQDYSVQKSEAYWISKWILEQKSLQYSTKKEAWFDSVTRKQLPTWKIEKHIPEKKEVLENNNIKELER